MHSIVCGSPEKNLRIFEGWKHVPDNLKTRRQWLRCDRKVPKGAAPVAQVVYPQVVQGRCNFAPEEHVLAAWDDGGVISFEPTPLFDLAQTAPYRPSPRTKAYWAFEDIFFRHVRKDCWIRKTDRDGTELEDWLTENEFAYNVPYHEKNCLTDDLIRQHINQRQIIGVKGDRLTRFVVIDHDFHGRNLPVFEAQAEILLDRFHGIGTWHFQVKRQDVTGLQMIYVFAEPRELAVVHREVRAILKELDDRHPELAAQAKSAGMKSFATLEIYPTQRRVSDDQWLETPDNGNGVRLPLCRDREMLLDKPLPLVIHRNRQVQDVVGYIRWLDDPNREYMPKERILDYLHYFARESPAVTIQRPQKPEARNGNVDTTRWKKNMRRWLYDFWIEGNANDRPLNEHIAVLCRLAATHGYSEPDIVNRVSSMVRGLPLSARNCSSRLLGGKYLKIEAVIRSTAKYACQGNGHQRDATKSSQIFAAALKSWPGFDPLVTSTWDVPAKRVNVIPNWTDLQRRRLCAFLRRPLFVKDDELIMRFVNGIVNLTLAKEQEGCGWGKEYLMEWMKDQFPEIKCAKDEKRMRIIRCLEAEGVIEVKYRGRAGMYATHWTVGSEAKLALGITDEAPDTETTTITQECPQALPNTSIYYGSLFSKEGVSGQSGCKDVCRDISGVVALSKGQTGYADVYAVVQPQHRPSGENVSLYGESESSREAQALGDRQSERQGTIIAASGS